MKTTTCNECGSIQISVEATVELDTAKGMKRIETKPIWGYTSIATCRSCGHQATLGGIGISK